ncbi:hypothetical protein Tco_1294888 [Tanacetum coccineum]
MYTFSPMMVANSRKHHCRVRPYTREVLVISTDLDLQKNHYRLDFTNRRGVEARIKNTWYNQGLVNECTMFLNVDQLEKQLDKEEFQEIGSMASFKVLEKQFQMFIKSRCIWMNNCLMTATTSQYTQLDDSRIPDTPIQHMESVKSRFDDKQKHKEEYNSWVNERQMQTTEGKVDTSNALDASLVDTESSGTALKEQDTSSRSGNDAHADDADIRPIYDEELNSEDKRTVNQCLLL